MYERAARKRTRVDAVKSNNAMRTQLKEMQCNRNAKAKMKVQESSCPRWAEPAHENTSDERKTNARSHSWAEVPATFNPVADEGKVANPATDEERAYSKPLRAKIGTLKVP